MNVKNTYRFTSDILKYEQLIEQLISEKNSQCFTNMEQLNIIADQFNRDSFNKNKKIKPIKTSSTTDVRPNLNNLGN